MFCRTALSTPGGNSIDVSFINYLFGAVSSRSKLDETVKRDVEPWRAFLVFLHKVGVDAPEDGLVSNNQDVFAAFKFHDNGFKTDDDIAIAMEISKGRTCAKRMDKKEILTILRLGNGSCIYPHPELQNPPDTPP